MTDVPESLQKIQVEEVSYRNAVSEATMTKMGATINSFIETGLEAVGTIVQSILTESQFQTLRGTNWVRMNGQDITGSDLYLASGNSITTLPDATSNITFFRQCDVGETNLTTYQASANLAHSHTIASHQSDLGGSLLLKATATTNIGNTSTGSSGGTESRPVNYSINYFIKINN